MLPGLEGHAWLSIVPEFDPFKYNSFPTNGGVQVFALTRRVANQIRDRAAADPGNVLPPVIAFKSTVDATVSTDAVIDNLLARLAPGRHALVLFDINRDAVEIEDDDRRPGPLDRPAAGGAGSAVRGRTRHQRRTGQPLVGSIPSSLTPGIERTERLGTTWPSGLISLSHVALPFPSDDPLYGRRAPENDDVLFLGEMALRASGACCGSRRTG